MVTMISKWGNSQGLRLPKSIIESLKLKIGQKVDITIEDDKVVIEPLVEKKKFDIHELAKNIPDDYKPGEIFDDRKGAEIW